MAYVYKIGWTNNNKYYIGCRVANKEPYALDLWKIYFTSSKYVRSYRKKHGEPDLFQLILETDDPQRAVDVEREEITKIMLNEPNTLLNKSMGARAANSYTGQRRDHLVHKNGKECRVFKDDLQKFLDAGWILREIIDPKPGPTGKRRIYLGDKEIYVLPSELENYIADGWQMGTQNCLTKACEGRVYVNNGDDLKMVEPDEIDSYISKGYVVGNHKISMKRKGGAWYTNGKNETYVSPGSDVPEGYVYGRLPSVSDSNNHSRKCENVETGEIAYLNKKDIVYPWKWIRKLDDTSKGKVMLTSPDLQFFIFVHPHDIDEKIALGFIMGNKVKRTPKSNVYNPMTLEHKVIDRKDLSRYLSEGWKNGTGKTGNTAKTIWINNGSNNKRIKEEDLEKFKNEGYVKGKL